MGPLLMLSAIVLTLNEESNIRDCLLTLSWADEVIVVDGGSTDQTISIAEEHGAKIYTNPFQNFSAQRNFSLEKATGDWVFFVDADERIPLELADEIQSLLKSNLNPCVFSIPRKTSFFKKRLRYSGTQGDYQTRLFPREAVQWHQPVHEKIKTELPIQRLKHSMLHHGTSDLEHYKQKLACYIPLEIKTMQEQGKGRHFFNLLLRPPAKFFYLYIWKLGLLDGLAGLQYAVLSSYYDFLKHKGYIFSK